MYDSEHVQRLILMQCFPPIIEYGCQYTYLSADLLQYLPKIEEMVALRLEINALAELVRTMFLICSNVC